MGIVQEIEIWLHEQMVKAQPRIYPGKWVAKIPLEFWDTDGSSNLGQTTKLSDSQQKKKDNLLNYGLCCPSWPQSKTERKWKER